MDEVLEAADLVQDTILEGVIAWLLRIIGVLAIIAGLGLWLLGDWALLWIPAVLIVVGVILIVIPQILLELLELIA